MGYVDTSVDEKELERIILADSPKFQSILKKSRKEIQEGRGAIP